MVIKKAAIVTLGCPKNTVSSRNLKKMLLGSGLSLIDDLSDADVIVVNTCGFIESAKVESIEALLELSVLKANGKCRKLYAVGCLAQRYQKDLYKSMPEIDGFLTFQEAERLPEIIGTEPATNNIIAEDFIREENPWAYLQISEGCDRRCSFCSIPMIKGKYRSRSVGDIVDEAADLVNNGVRELIVVGQDTGAYGTDLSQKTSLPQLISELSKIDELQRIRLMYLQPTNLTSGLVEEFRDNSKLCKYLDIPFQHASEEILRSMNRRGSGGSYLKSLALVREAAPGIAVRTAVIVGYPGESEAHFLELTTFIKEARPDYLGLFKFSREDGTVAATLPKQVTDRVATRRFNELKCIADEIGTAKKRSLIGKIERVLIDKKLVGDAYEGRLESQAPEIDGEILIRSDRPLRIGCLTEVKIISANGYDLEATSLTPVTSAGKNR